MPPTARRRHLRRPFLVCFLLSCVDACTSNRVSSWYLPLLPQEDFVVSFQTYDNATSLVHALDAILDSFPSPVSYSIARRPTTLSFPTDFVVWTLFDIASSTTLLTWLVAHDSIKSIVPNRRHRVHAASKVPASRARSPIFGTSPHLEAWGVRRLWAQNITGRGVKVAIFDTGLDPQARTFFHNVEEIINWTDEPAIQDADGHGSFVAGVLASANPACPGIAPDVSIYAFRVFTSSSASYTSWLLDALNYALFLQVDVINFSVGGPDFDDAPFVDKMHECAANRITIVSAVGNDGPYYGTLTNPADQMDVLGIGGLGATPTTVAPFSSRGMSLWEIASGYGRVKPDGLAPATNVQGLTPSGHCLVRNGTSMAAPLVAGMTSLLLSQMTPDERIQFGHIGFLKGLLLATATRLPSAPLLQNDSAVRTIQGENGWHHVYEQGAGAMNLDAALGELQARMASPTATIFPPALDLQDCPYMWPHCLQPLYHTMLPLTLNLTMFHPTAVTSQLLSDPQWIPKENGHYLTIDTTTGADVFWPYSGAIGVHMTVVKDVLVPLVAHGELVFDISDSPPVRVAVLVPLIPTPPPSSRILWDQFRNLQYPPAYIPRDNLHQDDEPFDSQGDHIHTNFADFWMRLCARGYHVEVLTTDYSCVDLTLFGLLLIVDPEEPWHALEIARVHHAVESYGVSVFVVADWFSRETMAAMHFWDANTLSTWVPIVGGANIPAVNALLQKYDVRFSDTTVWSNPELGYLSGTALVQLPAKSHALFANVTNDDASGATAVVAIAAMVHVPFSRDSGRIVAYGDSSCIDASPHMDLSKQAHANCERIMTHLLAYAMDGIVPLDATTLTNAYNVEPSTTSTILDLTKYSKVQGHVPACPLEAHE
ncbi:Aste57867_7538 [Aphanomyces stellatus]|uniref:subtilisin n=1 Tax=Aphanomyces stellatus TaxID=120398 RepID=A0A485KIH6_9STRA|nr:hypothetical protein As57867_007512 [Aphanomyces stellatus]VFT84447.1 Aste57867_7538 [Aphanomyces stellatus]